MGNETLIEGGPIALERRHPVGLARRERDEFSLLASGVDQRRRQFYDGRRHGDSLVSFFNVDRRLDCQIRREDHHWQRRYDRQGLQGKVRPERGDLSDHRGYGTGALLGRGVKRVKSVHWNQELGIAQAMWVIEAENMGPFIVESDVQGNSLFERENAKISANLHKVYEGTRPAVMKRFGETDDRSDELIG